jgi:hypothetical protein
MRVFLTPRWLALHLLAVFLVAVCLRLGWWQWQRAGEGNLRSYGYALQWPGFAVFVVVLWGHLVRDTLRDASGQRPPAAPAGEPAGSALLPTDPAVAAARHEADDDEEDEELAAYNQYLAWLHAADLRRQRR